MRDGFANASPSALRRWSVYFRGPGTGLPVKLHAEQLSDSGGTQLAARYGA